MKKKWILLKVVILFGLLMSLLAFANRRYAQREVQEVKTTINYEAGNHFITSSIVDTLLHSSHPDYPHMQMKRVDAREMEALLNQDEFISYANVYLENDGVLHAEIEQEEPVIRVHNGNQQYYICKNGKKINLSPKFAAKVMLVDGKIQAEDYQGLIELNSILHDDNLLKNLVIGIRKDKVNSFILVVEDGGYIVEIGPLENLKTKMDNFKFFHKNYIEKVAEMPYKKLNLRFSNQIVAVK